MLRSTVVPILCAAASALIAVSTAVPAPVQTPCDCQASVIWRKNTCLCQNISLAVANWHHADCTDMPSCAPIEDEKCSADVSITFLGPNCFGYPNWNHHFAEPCADDDVQNANCPPGGFVIVKFVCAACSP